MRLREVDQKKQTKEKQKNENYENDNYENGKWGNFSGFPKNFQFLSWN